MSGEGPVVIVGSGPAGLVTAESYRERGGREDVVMVGAESRPPYERPPLSKDFLRGESGVEDLPLRDAGFYAENRIELALGSPAAEVDLAARTLTGADGRVREFGRLVLATGSSPALPDIPGLDGDRVRTLRQVEDSERLTSETGPGVRVCVVGSGFIGCEAAVSLSARGASVTVVTDEDGPQADRLGPEVSDRISGWLAEAGVGLAPGSGVTGVEERGGGGVRVETEKGGLDADLVLVALGVARHTELAESAGIELRDGLIPVGSDMRTEADGVLAVGDIALAHNEAAGRALRVEHWGEAMNHGRAAGATLAGAEDRWAAAPGFWSGIGERTLKQAAWGDGYERTELEETGEGAFVARYWTGEKLVGVLTHDEDEAYERGREELERG